MHPQLLPTLCGKKLYDLPVEKKTWYVGWSQNWWIRCVHVNFDMKKNSVKRRNIAFNLCSVWKICKFKPCCYYEWKLGTFRRSRNKVAINELETLWFPNAQKTSWSKICWKSVILSIIWYCEGVLMIHFLDKDRTIKMPLHIDQVTRIFSLTQSGMAPSDYNFSK